MTSYTVFFEEAGQQQRVVVKPTGEISVPAEVYAAFEKKHPNAEIHAIQGWPSHYTVLFEDDGRQQRESFTPTGEVIPTPGNAKHEK